MSVIIHKHNRIICAIDIGIETETGRIIYVTESIRAEETTPFGVVVAALQIIVACFSIVVITAVTQGVDLRDLFLLIDIITGYGLNLTNPK